MAPLPAAAGADAASGAPPVPLWRRTVDPRSQLKRRWDALMLALVLYCTLIIPCVMRTCALRHHALRMRRRWNIGFTFDAAELACTAAAPADNCYPRHMARLDGCVAFLFWRAPARAPFCVAVLSASLHAGLTLGSRCVRRCPRAAAAASW